MAKIPSQATNTIMQAKRSFMIEHELEDAQAAYVEAVYDFRKAERGEDGGTQYSAVAAEARDVLNQAVQLDAGNFEYERDWYYVTR